MSDSSSDDECIPYDSTANCTTDSGRKLAERLSRTKCDDALEDQKWAMLAGQAAFNLQSNIFRAVLPPGLIKPHIFPRNISDMERMIDKCKNTVEEARLENAEQKWQELKARLHWKREHERVLEIIKSAYMHIAHPLEVLMRLPVDQKNNPEDTKNAFRIVLQPNLRDRGDEVLNMFATFGSLV